jgi:hypothetical protein
VKAEIVVTYEGITDLELKAALQGLRNVEQENPARIMMFAMVNVPDLPTEKVTQMLKELNPPLEYIKVISKSSSLASTRVLHEEPRREK